MGWRAHYHAKEMSPGQAVSLIPPGKTIFIGSGAAEPVGLVEALVSCKAHFCDNTVVHLLTMGPAPYADERYDGQFRHNAWFIGPNVRSAVRQGRADYTPVFLSQIPPLIRDRTMPVDVALIQVSEPDEFGFVNLGVSVDVVLSAIESAQLVIAEVNPRMPVVHGAGFISMNQIDAWTFRDAPLPVHPREEIDEVAEEIGRNVATLVDDQATLQVGIGQIPDAVLKALQHKKDLGIWTEMFSDGVLDLIDNGNVTGRFKTIAPHKISASFSFGTKRLYEYLNRNPVFDFQPSDYINDPMRVARQHKMVAINSALQIDLTGQVCADSIGGRPYSGIGGQVDFIRGASMCPGGIPVLAFRSTAKAGTISRIAEVLEPGSGVVTSRGDVHYVVTEHGVADLRGKSIRQRALALIAVADPAFRAELLAQANQRRYVFGEDDAPRSGYPPDYRKTITMAGGARLAFRPVGIADGASLRAIARRASNETGIFSWAQAIGELAEADLGRYLDKEHRKRVALVAEHPLPAGGAELVAAGRYHVDAATGYADVAIFVRDDFQRQGVGTELLKQLAQLARDAGVRGLSLLIPLAGYGVMKLLHASGLEVRAKRLGDEYIVRIPLAASPPART